MLKYQDNGFSFNKRSLFIIIGIAIYLAVGICLCLIKVPVAIAFIIALVPALPFLLSAIITISGLPFDIIIKRVFAAVVYNHDYRPYSTKEVKK